MENRFRRCIAAFGLRVRFFHNEYDHYGVFD